jgi:hypothetical protein
VRRTAPALLGALGALAAIVGTSSVLADDGKRPNVRVGMFSGGRCGKLADSLPTLVARSGLRPGDAVADVVVCVANGGETGQLSLAVSELVDVDLACSDGEASVDTSCGGNRLGELSPSLVQQAVTGSCASLAVDGAPERTLATLALTPLLVRERLRRNDTICIRLRLLYRAPNTAAFASQSDRTTWRYVFLLST